MIKDYNWMMRMLISSRLEATGTSQGLTTVYGIEATLPKPQGTNSDPVYQEVLRLEKNDVYNEKITQKVMFIQKYSKKVKGVKNQIILSKLLNGEPMRDIAKEMNMSLSGISNRKEMIVNDMYECYKTEQNEQITKNKVISCNS